MELKILDKSIYNHVKALKINPNMNYLNGAIIQSKCGLFEWTNFKDDKLFLKNSILSGKKTTSPFPTILIYDSPSLQKKAIDIFVKNEFEKKTGPSYVYSKHKIVVMNEIITFLNKIESCI